MQRFSFDRGKAAQSIEDPDGALWPVNAYSCADELNRLVWAAIKSDAITRPDSHAYLHVYPLSLSEPEPVLVYDPGFGPAFLGRFPDRREREGEGPVEFTLRLLEDVTAEANALADGGAPHRPSTGGDEKEDMNLFCPDCCSEGVALLDQGPRLKCGNCGATFRREEALVTVADAEGHAEQRAACTCSDVRGCPQCFGRADRLVGATVRDSQGRVWEVTEVDEKDGFPTVCGGRYWDRAADVEVLK